MGAPEGGEPHGNGNKEEMFPNLDEEKSAKVKSIMDQQREGTITEEEAQKQLDELGVEIPPRRDPNIQDDQKK